jgi:cytidine deaminase
MTLEEAARKARDHAYAPYSNFRVGAAVMTEAGNIHAGCNVENAAYPEGTCAEAGAIAAMVAAGETRIAEALVVADSPTPVSPCGGCRQKLAEFCAEDARITMMTLAGESRTQTMAELLPGAFASADMERQ